MDELVIFEGSCWSRIALPQQMGSFLRQQHQRSLCFGRLRQPAVPTRELLAPSQRAQFTDFTAPLDDRTLARFYTLSDNELELIRRRHRRASTQLLSLIHI